MNERRGSGKEQGARRIALARRKKAKESDLILSFYEISTKGNGIAQSAKRKVQMAKGKR